MSKNATLAFILSIIPGLGHFYVMGLWGSALRISFFWILLVLSIFSMFILTIPVWIWCALDAAGQAAKLNKKPFK